MMRQSKLEAIFGVALCLTSYLICIGGPILLAAQKREQLCIFMALFAMLLWHIISPRPRGIMLHFLMWFTVMASNTVLLLGILIHVLLRGKVLS